MENNQSADVKLDELSKDPAALEKALNEEVGAVDNGQTEQKKTESNEIDTEEVEQKKKSTAERFEKILSDRSEARRIAEAEKTEKERLSKEVEDLRLQLETFKKVSGSEAKADDTANKEGFSMEKVTELVEKRVSEVLSQREQADLAEKSTTEEIKATAEKEEFSGIKGREDEIAGIMKKHPTLTAAAAYLLLVGLEKGQDVNSNANKMGVGSRSNSDLLRDKKATEMTTKELNDELIRLANSGQLNF